MSDEDYIRRAMELAADAEAAGDVPIGAVLVSGDLVLEAKNEKESRPDATAHAEMLCAASGGENVERLAPFRRDALRDEGAVRDVRGRDGRRRGSSVWSTDAPIRRRSGGQRDWTWCGIPRSIIASR